MSRHPKADLYIAERNAGVKLRDIADKYGVSYQAVSQAVCKHGGYFRPYTEKQCVYPNLRKWLNEKKITRKEFLWEMGESCAGRNVQRITGYFAGKHNPSKRIIDKMLKVTGLTYEEMFWEGHEDG